MNPEDRKIQTFLRAQLPEAPENPFLVARIQRALAAERARPARGFTVGRLAAACGSLAALLLITQLPIAPLESAREEEATLTELYSGFTAADEETADDLASFYDTI